MGVLTDQENLSSGYVREEATGALAPPRAINEAARNIRRDRLRRQTRGRGEHHQPSFRFGQAAAAGFQWLYSLRIVFCGRVQQALDDSELQPFFELIVAFVADEGSKDRRALAFVEEVATAHNGRIIWRLPTWQWPKRSKTEAMGYRTFDPATNRPIARGSPKSRILLTFGIGIVIEAAVPFSSAQPRLWVRWDQGR